VARRSLLPGHSTAALSAAALSVLLLGGCNWVLSFSPGDASRGEGEPASERLLHDLAPHDLAPHDLPRAAADAQVDQPGPSWLLQLHSRRCSSTAVLAGASPILDTDAGTVSGTPFPGFSTVAPGSGLPEIGVFAVGSLHLQAGTIKVKGARALAIVACDEIELAGTIDASATDSAPGPGGHAGGAPGAAGDGPGGGQPAGPGTADCPSLCSSGGGGGGHGGTGGDGAAVDFTTATSLHVTLAAGAGGAASSAPDQLQGGSGGAGGTRVPMATTSAPGGGGGGGGVVYLLAGTTLTLLAGGVTGGGGGGGSTVSGGGAGGGSGGLIMLEAPQITLSGGFLAANGGGGGGGDCT